MLALEYVAGFFDGEGCITVIKLKRDTQHSGNKGFGLQTDITIVQKDISLLEKVLETLEFYGIDGKIMKHTTQNVYILRIRGFERQLKFCKIFKDLLILKRGQLLLLEEYLNTRIKGRWNMHSYAPLTDKELAMYEKMKLLKQTPYAYDPVIGGLS